MGVSIAVAVKSLGESPAVGSPAVALIVKLVAAKILSLLLSKLLFSACSYSLLLSKSITTTYSYLS